MEEKVDPKEDPDLILDLKEIGIHTVSPDKPKKKRQERVYCCWPWGICKKMKNNPGSHHHLCKEGIKARKKWLLDKEESTSSS